MFCETSDKQPVQQQQSRAAGYGFALVAECDWYSFSSVAATFC